LGPETAQQRQASVNEKDIDPANFQIPPMKEEDVDAIAVVDSMCFGTPRPEYR